MNLFVLLKYFVNHFIEVFYQKIGMFIYQHLTEFVVDIKCNICVLPGFLA